MHDCQDARRLGELNISIQVSPERRGYTQHPNRRGEKKRNKDYRFSQSKQTGACGDPASLMIQCLAPPPPVRSPQLLHALSQINADLIRNVQRSTNDALSSNTIKRSDGKKASLSWPPKLHHPPSLPACTERVNPRDLSKYYEINSITSDFSSFSSAT